MPVYFFTIHGYRTWMPDHRRGEGYCAPDEEMARHYEQRANQEGKCVFDAALQRILIEEAQVACRHQSFHLHGAGTDATHLHYLLSWRDDRHWMRLRIG